MARDVDFTPEEREEIRRRARERRARREAEVAAGAVGAAPNRAESRGSSQRSRRSGEVQERIEGSVQARRPVASGRDGAGETRRRSVDGRRSGDGVAYPSAEVSSGSLRVDRAYVDRNARGDVPASRRQSVPAGDLGRYGRSSGAYQAPKRGGAGKMVVAVVIALAVVVALAVAAYSLILKPSLSSSQSGTTSPASVPFAVVDTKAQVNSGEAEAAITLTLSGDHETVVLKGESYIEPGAHAVERCASDISSGIKVDGKVDTSKAGDYQVTYTATSSDGLKVSRTRTVRVVDSMDKDTDGIPVLMYHYVYSDAKGYHPDGAEGNSNYVLDTDLAAQLDYLVKNDYYFPSYAELAAYVSGTHSLPAKSVILSFDDGSEDFLVYGIPVLEQYKVPATSFIVGVDNIEPCLTNPSEYVTYQSHSYNMHHAGGNYGHGGVIGAMTKGQIVDDLKTNIALLGSADAFAYPYGDAPEDGVAAVHEAGILCAFTTDYDYAHIGDDPAKLSRIRVLGTYGLDSFIASLG